MRVSHHCCCNKFAAVLSSLPYCFILHLAQKKCLVGFSAAACINGLAAMLDWGSYHSSLLHHPVYHGTDKLLPFTAALLLFSLRIPQQTSP
jgi:hypothetical protein